MERIMKNGPAKIKSKSFALRIIKLYKYLCDKKKEFILSKQILRSGTSIGANLAESECAISENDFISKIYIALKECVETQYWLDLLKDSGYINQKEYDSIYKDCNEITKILNKTTKTMKPRV
jgi:four helix bundle protein